MFLIFRIVDNMPVTWCYLVEVNQQFCSTGFPMGCYVNSARQPKDACVMNVCIVVYLRITKVLDQYKFFFQILVEQFCIHNLPFHLQEEGNIINFQVF